MFLKRVVSLRLKMFQCVVERSYCVYLVFLMRMRSLVFESVAKCCCLVNHVLKDDAQFGVTLRGNVVLC